MFPPESVTRTQTASRGTHLTAAKIDMLIVKLAIVVYLAG
jgi:hypothetical protein